MYDCMRKIYILTTGLSADLSAENLLKAEISVKVETSVKVVFHFNYRNLSEGRLTFSIWVGGSAELRMYECI